MKFNLVRCIGLYCFELFLVFLIHPILEQVEALPLEDGCLLAILLFSILSGILLSIEEGE